MNILVVGKGGREHAIADAVCKSKYCDKLFVAPGNVGMKDIAVCVDIADDDIGGLVKFAKKENVGLTIVGPEHTLSLGIVDAFQKEGLLIFGPTKAATRIESSKNFAKEIMFEAKVPTASSKTYTRYEDALDYLQEIDAPIVIKEDGLRAGKGVYVCMDKQSALDALQEVFQANNTIVIEEYLEGFEYSLICFVHKNKAYPMEVAQDHKRAYDNDEGPNTGGMGVYSPVERITPSIVKETMSNIVQPTIDKLLEKGIPFTGFLYAGCMLCENGIKTIEFNARLGDPEAEIILPRLKNDFVEVILDILQAKNIVLRWKDNYTLGVVMASTNYPTSSTIDAPINNLSQVDTKVYHMGTKECDGVLKTNGGRVLIVVGEGNTLEEAYDNAYTNVSKIKSDALFYRHDIGKKSL